MSALCGICTHWHVAPFTAAATFIVLLFTFSWNTAACIRNLLFYWNLLELSISQRGPERIETLNKWTLILSIRILITRKRKSHNNANYNNDDDSTKKGTDGKKNQKNQKIIMMMIRNESKGMKTRKMKKVYVNNNDITLSLVVVFLFRWYFMFTFINLI